MTVETNHSTPCKAVSALFATVFAASMMHAVAAQETTTQFSGCLSEKGDLEEVAVGTAPLNECDKKSWSVTWNAVGPRGPQGPQGPQGPKGEDGESCSVSENGLGVITLSCPDGSSASWTGDNGPLPPPAVIAFAGTEDGDVWLTVTDQDYSETLSEGDQLDVFHLPDENCVLDTTYAGTYRFGERANGDLAFLGWPVAIPLTLHDGTIVERGIFFSFRPSHPSNPYVSSFGFILMEGNPPLDPDLYGIVYGRGDESGGIGVPAPAEGGYWLEANFDEFATAALPYIEFFGFTESTQPRIACGNQRLVVEYIAGLNG